MDRREWLKTSAVLAAGVAVSGCGGSSSGGNEAAQAYEAGAVPIEQSGWAEPGVFPGYPVLEADIDADVAVVGAGLAGCSLALHLAEAGVSVAVLEQRQPGWGASGRNAGHVLPTLKDIGVFRAFPDGGKAFLEAYREHHLITFTLARRLGIDCDATQSGYLNATARKGAYEKLKKESAYWRREQGQAVDWLEGEDMKAATGSAFFTYGVLYRDGGRVNPYRFTNGMAQAAARLGARIFGGTEAIGLEREGERWRLRSASGSVRAARVVFCTNAYQNGVVPAFADNFYPLTAYALSTTPLPQAARAIVMPGGATMAEYPIDLNPLVVDAFGRIIVSSIPSASRPDDAEGYFRRHLAWIHRTWPQTRDVDIRLQDYWTGRVALRDREFPGVFEVQPGLYGLMHFNAWGNLMAPLMGMLFARGLAADRLDTLPFPLEVPTPVSDPGRQDFVIRRLLIPAARIGQRIGLI